MAVTVSELQVVVTADTSKAESGLASFGSHVGGVATAFGAAFAAAGVAVAAGVGIAVKAAGDLEQAVANISTIKPDIDTRAVTASLTDMSTRVAQSSSQLGESLYNVFSSIDVSQEQALKLTEQFAQGAVAAQTDAATFGTSVIGVMNAYGLAVEDAGHVSDVFFNTVKLGVVTGQELASSLGPVTQAAKTAGVGINELGAMIAAVTKEGGPAAQNINNLNNFLQKITTTEAQNQLNALGIATKTATGEFRPTTDVLTDLKARLGDMTEAARANALQAIFPDAQARQGAATLISQLDLVKSATEENATATGVASAAYETMAATFNSQSKLLGNSLMAIATTIGGELLPSITPLVKTIAQDLPGAFAAARAAAEPEIQRIKDAIGTVKQVLAGDWAPSDEIDPFVNAVGKASLLVIQFGKDIAPLASEVGRLNDEVGRLTGSFGNLGSALGSGSGFARLLAADFKLMVLTVGEIVDAVVSAARAMVDFAGVAIALGRALGDLATGDIPAARDAIHSGDAAMADLIATGEEFAGRTAGRVGDGMQTIASLTSSSMSDTTAAVEGGMASATAAVETGMAASEAAAATGMDGVTSATETGMAATAAATETGMASAIAAVETAGPAMAAAGAADAAGVSAAIAAEGPSMASAAEGAASGAVAAVEGQAGSAAAAGASVGDSLGSGMMAGIQSWVGSVASAAANLVSAAIGAARAEADAQSPSKKTEQLGQDLAAGLEKGLASASIGDDMVAQIRDFVAASREYIPTAGEIKRVESDIAAIRQRSQTDALFRAEQMIDVNSEVLRLTQAQVALERDLVPVRQDLARATREVSDIERGSLADRQSLIEMDGQRQQLRLQEIDLEKQLIGLDRDSKRSKTIQDQIDKLRDQDQALQLEQDRIRTTNSLAATAAKSRREGLDDTARGQQTVVDRIKDQIDVLNAEQSVFSANENVIKNATDNEVAYRERLIAVFKSEATPLTDRIAAGLKLVDQLEKEGSISKELADQLRSVAREAGASEAATSSLGAAAATAAPRLGAAASQAGSLADAGNDVADNVGDAARSVDALSKSLGKLPDWFHPTSRQMDSLFGGGRAGGGPVAPGTSYLVGERGPELFSPPSAGTIVPLAPSGRGSSAPVETHRIELVIGGQAAAELYVTGRETAIRYGRVAGTTG